EAPQHMMTAYVRSLADEGFGLSEIGGKGQSLARLASAGLPVPNGFHITTAAYDDFIAEHQLEGPIDQQLAALSDPAEEATGQAASAIGALITSHHIPSAIAADIARAYQQLGSPPGGGRFFANTADPADASFSRHD